MVLPTITSILTRGKEPSHEFMGELAVICVEHGIDNPRYIVCGAKLATAIYTKNTTYSQNLLKLGLETGTLKLVFNPDLFEEMTTTHPPGGILVLSRDEPTPEGYYPMTIIPKWGSRKSRTQWTASKARGIQDL